MSSKKRVVVRNFSFTRPADTNAYAANDAVSNATSSTHALMTWTGVAPMSGMGGRVVSATLIKSTTTTTDAAFDLVLFDTAPTAFEDNAAFDPSDDEAKRIVGFVEFLEADVMVAGNNVLWVKTNLDLPYEVTSDAVTLWGALVARDGYAPGSAEVFTLRLGVEID